MQFGMKTMLAVLFVIALLLAVLPRGCDLVTHFDRGLHRRVQWLEVGTPRSEIFALLGEPLKTDVECCLPQKSGFENEFARAAKSRAGTYFLWSNGVNWYYCIGFDEDDKMVVLLEGSS